MLARGRLHVDREPRAEPLTRLDERVLADARHHLEMDVAVELVAVADCLDDVEESLLGRVGVLEDAGAEEESVDHMTAMHLIEEACELVDLEPVALAGDPVGVRAVVAVHDAVVGEHHAHEGDALAVGHGGLVDACVRRNAPSWGDAAPVRPRGSAVEPRRRSEDVVGGHAAEVLKLLVDIWSALDEHLSPPALEHMFRTDTRVRPCAQGQRCRLAQKSRLHPCTSRLHARRALD